MKLEEKIVLLRKQKGWSQEELAEQLDVSRQAVSKWESGQATPDVDKILKLSQIFGVSTDMLLKEDVHIFMSESVPQSAEKAGVPQSAAPSRPVPVALTIFRSAFWPLIVALYLLYSFFTKDWGRSWIIWPVAAMVFTVVNIIWSTVTKTPIDDD